MNILIIFLLSVAAHPDLICSRVAMKVPQSQPVVAVGGGGEGFVELAVTGVRGSEPVFDTGPEAHVESEDLFFYFSAHAQGVGDASGANLTPWLGLRPIGEVRGSVLSGASEPAQAPSGKREKACSWSPGGAAFLEPSAASGTT